MGFLIGLLMLAGFLFGGGNQYVVLLFFLFALIINVVMYWYSDRLVLKMYRAKVLDEGRTLYYRIWRQGWLGKQTSKNRRWR